MPPTSASRAFRQSSLDRKRPPYVRRRVTDGAQTDVFDAVRDDEPKTGPIPGLATGGAATAEEHTSSVATAERDAPTEEIRDYDAEDRKS